MAPLEISRRRTATVGWIDWLGRENKGEIKWND